MSEEKITLSELEGLFGSYMPIEAAELIFHNYDNLNLSDIRKKLIDISMENNND